MNALLNYLKNPVYCSIEKPKLTYLLKLYFVYLIAIIPVGIVANSLIGYFNLNDLKPELSQANLIVYTVLIGPVFEEVLFRLLLRFTKRNLIIFFAVLGALSLYYIFQLKVKAVIILSLIMLIIVVFLQFYSRRKIELFISSNFKYFFYFTAISFGLLHAFNFTGNISLIITFSLIIGGPQIIAGLILGFIRMKYGIVYSILFHMMINSIAIFLFS